jgi:DNA invertase Pin-like site-specific DNA recombinase
MIHPRAVGALPTDRPIVAYYRQSSMAQVGNISTDMQQIDLPKYVTSLGWQANAIILIDEDEGVSGAKRIDERAGMSRLLI